MQMYEYQLEAAKTRNEGLDLNYFLGKVAIEGGEAWQHEVKRKYHGKTLDRDAIIEELGDILWNISNAADDLGVTLEYIADANIAKLRKRHGESYNPAHYATLPVFAATE